MAVVERIEAIPFSLPLARASKWGRWGTRSAQDHVVVRITDSDGAWGIAEATPRPSIYGETPTSVLHAIESLYAPIVAGGDIYDVRGHADRLRAVPWNLTARAALDIALHDLQARKHGITLAAQLGATPAPVQITYMLALRDPETTAVEANEMFERWGVRSFKVKLGGDARRDRRVLESLRVASEQWTITADANGLYALGDAHVLQSVLAGLRVDLLEDPFPRTGLAPSPHESRLPTAVIADEHMTDTPAAARALALDGIDGVCIKPPRTGVLGSLDIAGTAAAVGKVCWVGSQGVSELGALASAHIANAVHTSSVPADLGTFLRQEENASLLTQPLTLTDGAIVLPDAPGSGVELDAEKLERFRAG